MVRDRRGLIVERCYLKQLKLDDGASIFEMLQRIGSNENEFTNEANGMSYEQYQNWLIEQDHWSRGEKLPEGFVAQTIYWLFNEDDPIGIGKIRHSLTESSMRIGGNIGYAIDPLQRGKGYASFLLKELIKKADLLGISQIMLTVEKYNLASKKVIEKNKGILINETNERWYFTIEL